jgi:hypothetical protein
VKGPIGGRSPPAPSKADALAEERKRLGQIVHDLNSPLSAVALQLFLRRKALVDPTPQELHFLDILDRNVARIRALVGSVLPTPETLARIPPLPSAPPPTPLRRRVRSTW